MVSMTKVEPTTTQQMLATDQAAAPSPAQKTGSA
jgi:hypothetical protein